MCKLPKGAEHLILLARLLGLDKGLRFHLLEVAPKGPTHAFVSSALATLGVSRRPIAPTFQFEHEFSLDSQPKQSVWGGPNMTITFMPRQDLKFQCVFQITLSLCIRCLIIRAFKFKTDCWVCSFTVIRRVRGMHHHSSTALLFRNVLENNYLQKKFFETRHEKLGLAHEESDLPHCPQHFHCCPQNFHVQRA